MRKPPYSRYPHRAVSAASPAIAAAAPAPEATDRDGSHGPSSSTDSTACVLLGHHERRLRLFGVLEPHPVQACGVEQVAAQHLGQRLPCDLFDQLAERDVVEVVVVLLAAELPLPGGLVRGQGEHLLGGPAAVQVGRDRLAVGVLVDGVVGEAAAHVQHLPHGGAVGGERQSHVVVDRGVEVDPARARQPHHGRGGERLGDAGQREAGVGDQVGAGAVGPGRAAPHPLRADHGGGGAVHPRLGQPAVVEAGGQGVRRAGAGGSV